MARPDFLDGSDCLEPESLFYASDSGHGQDDAANTFVDQLQSVMDNFHVTHGLSNVPAEPCEGISGIWPTFIAINPTDYGIHLASSCIGAPAPEGLNHTEGSNDNNSSVSHTPFVKTVKYDGFLPVRDEVKSSPKKQNTENSEADVTDNDDGVPKRSGGRKARGASEERSSRSRTDVTTKNRRNQSTAAKTRQTSRTQNSSRAQPASAAKNRRNREESKDSTRASRSRRNRRKSKNSSRASKSRRSSDDGKSRRRSHRTSQSRRRNTRTSQSRRRNTRSSQSRRRNSRTSQSRRRRSRSSQNRRRRNSEVCKGGVCKLRRDNNSSSRRRSGNRR